MVPQCAVWQGDRMYGRTTQAGGCLLSLSVLVGLTIGIFMHEATRGAVIGTAVGVLIALAVWLLDRKRGG